MNILFYLICIATAALMAYYGISCMLEDKREAKEAELEEKREIQQAHEQEIARKYLDCKEELEKEKRHGEILDVLYTLEKTNDTDTSSISKTEAVGYIRKACPHIEDNATIMKAFDQFDFSQNASNRTKDLIQKYRPVATPRIIESYLRDIGFTEDEIKKVVKNEELFKEAKADYEDYLERTYKFIIPVDQYKEFVHCEMIKEGFIKM